MKPKLFTLLLAVAASVGTIFAESGTCGNNLTWDLTDSVLTISGMGNMQDFNIYDDDGSGAGDILPPWYSLSKRHSIKHIVVEDGVSSIGKCAFCRCDNLKSVSIGNSVTSIGDHAFRNDSTMLSIIIGNSVTHIGFRAFYWCNRLTSIIVPNSVTSIGGYAFYNCSGLTSVTIGNSVTNIGERAFYNCSGLTSVTIPNSVDNIGSTAFYGCTGLTKVNITDIAAWCNIEFANSFSNPLSYAKHLYVNDTEITELVIPNSVTSIGVWTFCGCIGLTSVTIPNSVTSIGESAFSHCTSLTSVTIPNSVTSIGIAAFYECSSLTSITIPNSVTSFGNDAFHGCTGLTSVSIGNGVTSIGEYAFMGCNSLRAITWNIKKYANFNDSQTPFYWVRNNNIIFDIRTQITSFAFGNDVEEIPAVCAGMTNLRDLTIGSSVTTISTEDFSGCNNIKNVTINSNAVASKNYGSSTNLSAIFGTQVREYIIGEGVSAIGNYAFYNAGSLQSITLPSSIQSIGNRAFYNCSKLKTVNISSNAIVSKAYTATNNFSTIFGTQVQTYNLGEAITSIGDYAFYNCSNATSLNIPDGVTTIGNNSFAGCSGVTSLVIPESVTSIGNDAFRECAGVETLNLPNVTTIGNSAFADCSNLTSLQLGNNLTTIGDSTFSSCYNLATIEFPNSLQTIGNAAFFQCNHLSSVTLGSGINQMGHSVFKACTGLRSAVIPENFTSIESNTFHGCTALSSVNLPNTLTSINDSAFFNCSSLQLESLPSAVTTLGKGTFSGCGSLASIAMPASITSIGENAFNDCSGIAEVKIEDLDSWCKIDFGNSKSNPVFYSRNLYIGDSLIAELTIPNKITELKPWAFVNCNGINSVFIPNTVRLFSPNAFYDCENIASVEWHAKNIADYASSAASPFYASRSKITSFVFGEETEHIPSHLCSGMNKINSLTFPSYLKSIGDYSFKGLTKIRKINIPNEVTSIGAHAFDSCILVTSIYLGYQVEEIGDYAFKGCIRVNDITSMNTITPVVYENTLSSISDYAYLYVPAGSKRTYQLDPYWGRFDIREIASEEATLTKGSVTVEANEDNAIFTWPTDSAASTYSLQITKDGVVFCTLVFNSNGQLTGIAFAPGRNGREPAPAATLSVAGMSFTVTGLTSASKYAYHLAVKDEDKKDVQAYSGEFATTGYVGEINEGGDPEINPEGIEDIFIDGQKASKILHNGQIFILRGEKIYTLTGQEVK